VVSYTRQDNQQGAAFFTMTDDTLNSAGVAAAEFAASSLRTTYDELLKAIEWLQSVGDAARKAGTETSLARRLLAGLQHRR
jgi:hypothetical protein